MLRIYNCPQATAFFPPQNSPSNASTRLARLRRTALPPWPGASATRRVPRPGSPVPHDPERRAAFFRQIRRGPRLPPATGPRVGGTAQAQPLGLRHPTELAQAGHHISINALTLLLREEGFARLPRRRDEERPTAIKAETAEVADVRRLDLSPRSFRTAAAGLFLFVPLLEGIDLKRVVEAGRLPGSKMIPAEQAVRSLLALKLLGTERKSHVMDLVFDPAIALFAGLNVVPKRVTWRPTVRGWTTRQRAADGRGSSNSRRSACRMATAGSGLSHGAANTATEPLEKHHVSAVAGASRAFWSFWPATPNSSSAMERRRSQSRTVR